MINSPQGNKDQFRYNVIIVEIAALVNSSFIKVVIVFQRKVHSEWTMNGFLFIFYFLKESNKK